MSRGDVNLSRIRTELRVTHRYDWPGADLPPLCPLPASQSTVLAYLGSLLDDGIKASSLKPYLSAINYLYADLRFRSLLPAT